MNYFDKSVANDVPAASAVALYFSFICVPFKKENNLNGRMYFTAYRDHDDNGLDFLNSHAAYCDLIGSNANT